MNALPGIGGSLFPGRYLVDGLHPAGATTAELSRIERRRRQMDRWWQSAALACGPATGLRAVVDLMAVPLAGALEFRVSAMTLERRHAVVALECADRTPVGLFVMPWAATPSSIWRDVANSARAMNARWCFVLAPPFLSLVDARAHLIRHSVDFTLPDVLAPESFRRFWTLASAQAFRSPRPIEALVKDAAGFQDAVRVDLQFGVLEALSALGGALGRSRDPVDEGLTLVYRLLFLLFAESRDLVPRSHPIYGKSYSVGAFCQTALTSERGEGLWDGLAAVTRLSRVGCRVDDLIVRPFNGRLFARSSAPSLETTRRRAGARRAIAARDAAMRQALVALSTRQGRAGREHISYADLGVEQLGAVYERVLDADVTAPPGAGRPARVHAGRTHSLRRKQTGTFYTPQSLAEFVVRRTLAPLVAAATADDILALRVVDPAMGSGAFLVAACRYLSNAYERALVDEGRCSETDLDDEERANIRRLIAERCLAGVDVNPVAVQLARLSLWLTTLSRGKPLGFLDHRLRVGNSLIGASPDDLRRLTSRNRRPKTEPGTLPLFEAAGLEASMRLATQPLVEMSIRPDDTVDDVRAKERLWARLSGADSPLAAWRDAANLWCARWFTDAPASPAELRAALDAVLRHDSTLQGPLLARRVTAARQAATAHGFFHWPLEFADAFYDEHGQPKPNAGFDAVIGNPPWEMVRNESHHAPTFANASAGNPRTRLRERFGGQAAQFVRFVRDSGLFPNCDRGHLNLYQPFVERALTLTRPGGRLGLILPWGLAVDDGAAKLRAELLTRGGLDTVVGLDNAAALFPIHRGLRFLVAVATAGRPAHVIRGRFGVRTADELDSLPDRVCDITAPDAAAFPVRMSERDVRLVGGPSLRIPDVRCREDFDLLDSLARRYPPLGDTAGWGARFGRELNATEDRDSFGAHGLPVIEGKHLSPFVTDLSAATSRIERRHAARLLPDGRFDRARLAYRDVSGVGNRLSLIAAIVPAGVVTTHTVFCLRTALSDEQQHFLCGLFNSYVLNAVVRLLMGGHVTTGLVEGLPAPPWTGDAAQRRIAALARVMAHDPHASGVEAELQCAVARMYALDAGMFAHVLHGFPLVASEQRDAAMAAFC